MDDASAVVLYEERDGVAFVTLNRPEKKNTLTEAMITGIADSIDRAAASREARAVVLRGAGGDAVGLPPRPGAGQAVSADRLRDRRPHGAADRARLRGPPGGGSGRPGRGACRTLPQHPGQPAGPQQAADQPGLRKHGAAD